MLTKLGQEQSAGKAASEASLKPKSPTVVRIDTTPLGPRAQRIQAWTKILPGTPTSTSGPTFQTIPMLTPTLPTPIVMQTLPSILQPTAPFPGASTLSGAEGPVISVPSSHSRTSATTAAKPTVPATLKPLPPVGATPTDPTLVALLTNLVDKVDALNLSHQTVLKSSGQMSQQLASQSIQMAQYQDELERLRAISEKTRIGRAATSAHPTSVEVCQRTFCH
jgi:hypothetical protein